MTTFSGCGLRPERQTPTSAAIAKRRLTALKADDARRLAEQKRDEERRKSFEDDRRFRSDIIERAIAVAESRPNLCFQPGDRRGPGKPDRLRMTESELRRLVVIENPWLTRPMSSLWDVKRWCSDWGTLRQKEMEQVMAARAGVLYLYGARVELVEG